MEKYNFNKLSQALQHASLDKTRENLVKLRHMTVEGAELGEEIGQVIAGLRQIAAPAQEPFVFTTCLEDNQKLMQVVLRDCDDVKFRSFLARDRTALLIYLDGMTDLTLLEKNILEILMKSEDNQDNQLVVSDLKTIQEQIITSASVTQVSQAQEAIESLMTGNSLLFIDGIAEVLVIGTKKYEKRPIGEAKEEGQVRGPHDAFNETLSDNLVLIRRRSRDTNLKVRVIKLGDRTRTAVAILYVADLVKPGLLAEVERRLHTIHTDVLIIGYNVAEALSDHPWTPFPQTLSTEKPERVSTWLYEGKVALLIDNTPYALAVPCTYTALMHSPDDYTIQPFVASLIRLTRHLSAFIAIYLPAVYIAIISYHPGLLPTPLAMSIAELRSRTPFPSFLEAIMMEALLELFQESIVRLPNKLAGAASVIGAFIIGTTVVQAGLVNALLVVVTAVTGIAAYSISSYSFSISLRALRLPMLILASVLGIYGVVLGAIVVTVHLCSLHNFGESFLGGLADITLLEDWKDTVLRFPTRYLRTRPKEIGSQDRGKMGSGHG